MFHNEILTQMGRGKSLGIKTKKKTNQPGSEYYTYSFSLLSSANICPVSSSIKCGLRYWSYHGLRVWTGLNWMCVKCFEIFWLKVFELLSINVYYFHSELPWTIQGSWKVVAEKPGDKAILLMGKSIRCKTSWGALVERCGGHTLPMHALGPCKFHKTRGNQTKIISNSRGLSTDLFLPSDGSNVLPRGSAARQGFLLNHLK